MFILYLALTSVVLVEAWGMHPSNNNIRFSTLSIFVPSSNVVYPSQVFKENIAALCEKGKS